MKPAELFTRIAPWAGFVAVAVVSGFASMPARGDGVAPSGAAGMLIRRYHMQPIPLEGAWFSLSYSSDDVIAGNALPLRYAGRDHKSGSAILLLETHLDFSALHRLRTDEVWHFYSGSPLQLLLLYPDGKGRTVTLGPNAAAGEVAQFTVPHGVWQGSAPRSAGAAAYSFAGTQLSPAFDAADFEIGYRDELQQRYPVFTKDIARLTRAEYAVSPAPAAKVAAAVAQGTVILAEDDQAITVSPGVGLQELVGRVAADAKTASISVAKFTLGPGKATAVSFNRRSQEVLLVTDGTGSVHLGDKTIAVSRDAVIFIPATVVHSIEADGSTLLTFYAISAPAYSPPRLRRGEGVAVKASR